MLKRMKSKNESEIYFSKNRLIKTEFISTVFRQYLPIFRVYWPKCWFVQLIDGRNQNFPPSWCFPNRQQQNLLPLAEEETEVVLHQQHAGHTQCLSLIEAELTCSSPRIREPECCRVSHQPWLHVILHRLQEGSWCCTPNVCRPQGWRNVLHVQSQGSCQLPYFPNNSFYTIICT